MRASTVPNASTPSSGPNAIDLPVRAGEILEGKFKVERIIGEGGMGLVVEATSPFKVPRV